MIQGQPCIVGVCEAGERGAAEAAEFEAGPDDLESVDDGLVERARGGVGGGRELVSEVVPQDAALSRLQLGSILARLNRRGFSPRGFSRRGFTRGRLSRRGFTRERLNPRCLTRERLSPRCLTRERLNPRCLTRERLSPRCLTRGRLSPRCLTRGRLSLRCLDCRRFSCRCGRRGRVRCICVAARTCRQNHGEANQQSVGAEVHAATLEARRRVIARQSGDCSEAS